MNLISQISETLEPLLRSRGIELVDMVYAKEGPQWVVRLFVDKPPAITLDECAEVSRMVSEALDQTDLIKQAYSLEVSSPGLQRTLKLPRDAERFAGQIISARLFSLHEGRRQFKGRLAGIDGERLALVEEGDVQCLIPLSLIAEAHLDPEIRF